MHSEREQAALAMDRLAFDPSPAGRRRLRLRSRLLGQSGRRKTRRGREL